MIALDCLPFVAAAIAPANCGLNCKFSPYILEYIVMTLTKFVRSIIFFLSVTALICFVLDHLLCPASKRAVVAKDRSRHRRQIEV